MQRGTVICMSERELPVVKREAAWGESLSPELLFRRHYRPLVATLTVACGNRELAADAVQDAFVELCKRWSKISGYERPEAWLMRVAVNRTRSEQRSLRRRATALLRLGASPTEDLPGIPAHIVQAFRNLPPRQRLACSLFYVLDLPLQEVAQTMGISVGAAGTHLHRARTTM
ncbi:MAG: sigma-70 family RNA polymerase sigma factor, partial [Thermoleophilia bacterium]|nr:sigma-70 family RNA polymerase sigma factor [Thermoleophilia bacterium]